MGNEGLGATTALAGLREGEAYKISGAAGPFEGTVLLSQPPLDFAATVRNLNDALLRYELYGGRAKLWVATWGVEESRVGELEQRLKAIVGSL